DTNSAQVSVLLGNGDGSFRPLQDIQAVPTRSTLPGDVDHDGVSDLVPLSESGAILFRRGRPGDQPLFAPPVVINPDRPARGVARGGLERRDGRDGAAASRASGAVPGVFTDAAHGCSRIGRFSSGDAASGLDLIGRTELVSLQEPVSLAGGDFTGDGRAGVAV